MKYDYEQYDILQVSFNNGTTWDEYSSLKNVSDALAAQRMVRGEMNTHTMEGRPMLFRIIGRSGVKYTKPAPTPHVGRRK